MLLSDQRYHIQNFWLIVQLNNIHKWLSKKLSVMFFFFLKLLMQIDSIEKRMNAQIFQFLQCWTLNWSLLCDMWAQVTFCKDCTNTTHTLRQFSITCTFSNEVFMKDFFTYNVLGAKCQVHLRIWISRPCTEGHLSSLQSLAFAR